MSEVRIQRMVDGLWGLEAMFAPGVIHRQLVLDVYRRGDIALHQRVWLDHGHTGQVGKGGPWGRQLGGAALIDLSWFPRYRVRV